MNTTQSSTINLSEKNEGFHGCPWREIDCNIPYEERGKADCFLCVLGNIGQQLEGINEELFKQRRDA